MAKLILLSYLFLALPLFAEGAALKNTPGTGSVEFLAVGRPSMLKIHGKAPGPTADLRLEQRQLKGSVEMELGKLETGISLRDEHMKDKYLHVKEFPRAKLTLLEAPADEAFAASLSNGGERDFKGKLELHGKEREVSGKFTAQGGLVKASFPITLSEFGVDVPKYLGVTVADSVSVTVEIPLRKE